MISIDYILLCIINLVAVVWVIYHVSRNEEKNNKSTDNSDTSSNDDGGISFDLDPPQLDLPPGVTLPIDSPDVEKEKDQIVEI